MTNFKDLFNAVSKAFSYPAVIPLPTIKRPHCSGTKPLSDVRSEEDLPSRFLTGDLVAFHHSVDGWVASYSDQVLRTDVTVTASGRSITIEESIRGQRTIFLVYPLQGSWKELARPIAATTPQILIQALGPALSERFNVHLVPWEKEWPSISSIPDGFMFDLYLPIPVTKLMDLFDLHQKLACGDHLPCSLSGQLRLHGSVVNYMEGKNVPLFLEAAETDVRNILELGTPVFEQARREVGPDGSAALTLRRIHYAYHASSHYRCLPYLLHELRNAGLIGAAPGYQWQEGFPHAPEYEAWVIPAPLMSFGWSNLARNIGNNSRRITILSWEPEVSMEASTGWVSEPHSRNLVLAAEIAATRFLQT